MINEATLITRYAGSLCAEDVRNLARWTLQVKDRDSDRLAPAGWRELEAIAQRFKKRLPTLLGHPYSSRNYEVITYSILN